MHAAPPVRVTIGRSAAWTLIVSTVWTASAASASAWVLLQLGSSDPAAAAMALFFGLAGGATAAVVSWHSQVPGTLDWDGRGWHWRGQACRIRLAHDVGKHLLLEVRPGIGRTQWLLCSKATGVGPWALLRAAIYSDRAGTPMPELSP